ncbi:MAG: ROK family protein [Tidjanibacter sp.]|nr:ROK family protein [Tidjanibacter sp.]
MLNFNRLNPNTPLAEADIIKDTILRHCIYNGNQMIPQMATALGYSVPTIAKYVGELLNEGYFIECGKMDSHRGRKPIIYGVNPSACYFIGVDIARFALNIGVMNIVGEIVYESTIKEFNFENTPATLDKVCQSVREVISQSGVEISKVLLANINISGRVNSDTGESYSVFNFEENDEPLASILSEKIGLQVRIENDSRAMTFGELSMGSARGYRNALFINASWGIGLGIIVGGGLYYGRHGYSGEIGHMNVYNNEIMCHCGKKGCLETEVSGFAIHRKLLDRIRQGQTSILSSLVASGQPISTLDIVRAATRNEDPLCIELIEQTGAELGRQLANLINIFNPEAVVVGGVLALADDYFITPIRSSIRKYSLKLMCKDVEVVVSANPLKAGMIGACMIARQSFFPQNK